MDTDALNVDTWLGIILYPFIQLLKWAIAIKPEVCAEYMLYALLDAKKGLSRRNDKGDDVGKVKFPEVEGAQQKLWEHSIEATKSTVM